MYRVLGLLLLLSFCSQLSCMSEHGEDCMTYFVGEKGRKILRESIEVYIAHNKYDVILNQNYMLKQLDLPNLRHISGFIKKQKPEACYRQELYNVKQLVENQLYKRKRLLKRTIKIIKNELRKRLFTKIRKSHQFIK